MFYSVKIRVVNFTLEEDGSQKAGKPATETYLIHDTSTEGASARAIEKFNENRGGVVIEVKETKFLDVYAD